MTADDLALPTLVVAVISATLAGLAIAIVFITRYRDRVELQVMSVTLKGAAVLVHIRNRGGTPTVVRGVFLEGGGTWLNMEKKALAGRSETDFVTAIVVLKSYGRIGGSLHVQDVEGRRSPSFPISADVLAAVNG